MDLKELIKNNKYNVKNIIKKITQEDNEDIEQEVYIRAWQNQEKYQETGKLKGWIGTIAKNLSKDYLKSATKKYETPDIYEGSILNDIKDKKETPENEILRKERQKIVWECIKKLNPKHKEVIILYEFENQSYEEISKKIKCPIGTIKSRIYNAKKELYEQLKDTI